NDDPQPQVDFALGFLMVKPPPVIVSTKSTSAPFRYRTLIGSTNSFTPCDSNTMSPDPCPFSSIISPYWKPEQPPPCTNTRRPLPPLFSSVSSSLIFPAAVSETLIMILISPGNLYHYTACLSSRSPGPIHTNCTIFRLNGGRRCASRGPI